MLTNITDIKYTPIGYYYYVFKESNIFFNIINDSPKGCNLTALILHFFSLIHKFILRCFFFFAYFLLRGKGIITVCTYATFTSCGRMGKCPVVPT